MAAQNSFRSSVVIITGASAGIGRALAMQLARQGAWLALAARRLDRLEQVAGECRSLGGKVIAIQTDVSEQRQCKNLVERTVEAYGRLDMLVNNAGLGVGSLFESLPDLHLFEHVMNVNFYGAVYCTYHALPHLIASRGRIVAISSVGGKAPIPYNTSYIASKYALHGFYDSLRMELSEHKVSATVVCPYWVVTEFHEAQLDKDGIPRGARGRQIYTRKMMSAERCAELVLQAAHRRKRELVMGPGKMAEWLKLMAPGLLEWFTLQAFLKPVIRRTQKSSPR